MNQRLGRHGLVDRRCGSCVGRGLGRLGLVTLRLAEVWVGGSGLGSTWAGDEVTEAGDVRPVTE